MFKRNKKGQFMKGYSNGPRSIAVKKAISIANRGKNNGMWRGGKPNCKECGIRISYGSVYCRKHLDRPWLRTKEVVQKSAEWRRNHQKNDKDHYLWKGENAGYVSKHKWIRKHKGDPNRCDFCGTTENRRYEWANINGKYYRKLEDYIRLCVPCHRRYDYKNRKK